MESNKGIFKWIIGVGVLVLIIYSILVMSAQQKNDIAISRDNFNEEIMKFDKDFYETQADITLKEESKERLINNAKQIENELTQLKTEREEKIKKQKELEEKEKRVFEQIEKEFNKREKEDSFFRIN